MQLEYNKRRLKFEVMFSLYFLGYVLRRNSFEFYQNVRRNI